MSSYSYSVVNQNKIPIQLTSSTDWFRVIFMPISVLYGYGISSEITLLQSSLPNPLKPGVKLRMKMPNYIWVINNFVAY